MFLVYKKVMTQQSLIRQKKIGAIIEIAHVKVRARETQEDLCQHQKDRQNEYYLGYKNI